MSWGFLKIEDFLLTRGFGSDNLQELLISTQHIFLQMQGDNEKILAICAGKLNSFYHHASY